MKTFLFSLAALLFLSTISAQTKNNAVFFTENGEKFYLILNGIKQNAVAETNVKVTDLIQPNYKVKILFENKTLAPVDQTIYFMDGAENANLMEFTYSVALNKKGEYKVRQRSNALIAQLPPPPAEQKVIVYTPVEPPAEVVTTTTTTKTSSTDNVNMGVNMGGLGINMNVNVNSDMGGGNTQTTQTTTKTTTTRSYSSYNNTSENNNGYATEKVVYVPGYNGPVGCPRPMSPSDFESAKNTIVSKSFDDTKLTISKQIIGSNCLLSTQVKEIMLLFSFENTRLDLAKYSYDKTYDQGNYFKLNDAFTFESSISELNNYINKGR